MMDARVRRLSRALLVLTLVGVLLGGGAHAAVHAAHSEHAHGDGDMAACVESQEHCELCAVKIAEPPPVTCPLGSYARLELRADALRSALLPCARIAAHGTRGPPAV
jgi:hypothetical protein